MISPAQSVEQLLTAARARHPAERAAFLNDACGDFPDLRKFVEERLTAEDEGSASTLDQSLPRTATQSRAVVDGNPPLLQGYFAAGQLIAGRFTVVRYIARGGMGEVYEVEDQYLQGVHVALKVILPEIAEDAGASERFEQEVLLARKVTHPNLCPIYDIARCSDPPAPFLFLTMKLLTGETLSARLRRPDPIPRDEKIAIFRQTIAGVTTIHAAGVIHRDIKPNNVMLDYSASQVCVSIMDFGLAKLHNPDATLAAHSLIAGTPGYMAPEVLSGHGPSQAADLFALGVLLHQVATGERPQMGAFNHSVKASSSLDTADVPPYFISTVKDFLSSDPDRRCKSAEAIAAELEGRSTLHAQGSSTRLRALVGAVCLLVLVVSILLVPAVGERVRGILFATREKHIVILPFQLNDNKPETQALGDGVMDSLAGRLSNLDTTNQSLWVVPASEVRSRKVVDATSAFREFGATLVLEGRFEHENASTHLQLTLVDAKKLRDIGFVDVESKTGDLSTLQDQAVTILQRLMDISGKQQRTAKKEEPVSRAAYEDYLVAVGYAQRYDRPGNLDRAVASLESALRTDPRYTLGYARLAQVYVMKYRLDKNPAWLDQATEYSKRALQSDAKVLLAHVALGQVEQYTGHHDLAAQEFQHAVDLYPRDPEALTGLAASYRDLGKNAEAEAIYIRAAELRPEDWNGYNTLGQFYKRVGRSADAIREFRRAIELSPDNSGLYVNLGGAYLNVGNPWMISQAEQFFIKSVSINPNYAALANLGVVYGWEKRYADSISAIQEALKLNDKDYQVWCNLAEGYEWIGDETGAQNARGKAQNLLLVRVKSDPEDADAQATLALIAAKDSFSVEALKRIQIALALEPRNESVLASVADAYELLGERKLALRYLEKALVNGTPAASLKTDPYLRNALADPHFHPLKARAQN